MKNLLFAIIFLPNTISKGEVSVIGSSITDLSVDVVTLTTYTPTKKETDSTPNITASGYKIDTSNPKKHKIIAISRDLSRKHGWKFKQKLRIRNAGKLNGDYVFEDVMNKRHKNRIDILIGENDKQVKLDNVQIVAIK